jgi:hypothetical protein
MKVFMYFRYYESFCQAETLRLCMIDEFNKNRVDYYI